MEVRLGEDSKVCVHAVGRRRGVRSTVRRGSGGLRQRRASEEPRSTQGSDGLTDWQPDPPSYPPESIVAPPARCVFAVRTARPARDPPSGEEVQLRPALPEFYGGVVGEGVRGGRGWAVPSEGGQFTRGVR